jgi:Fe-S-cluster containining protein
MSDMQSSGAEEAFMNDGSRMAEMLPQQVNKLNFIENLRQTYNQVDLLTDSFSQHCQRAAVQMDCKLGCSWCCHQSVFALTHEVLVLVDYLHRKFSPEIVAEVERKAIKKAQITRKLTNRELLKHNKPCPLLHNGACMVYPVRPMACRIYLSSDVKTCEDRYKRPGHPDVKPALFGFMLDAGRNMNYGYVTELLNRNMVSNEAPLEWLLSDILQDATSFD